MHVYLGRCPGSSFEHESSLESCENIRPGSSCWKVKVSARSAFESSLTLIVTRPDQLVLHDDPAFMPDNLYPVIDMDMNYSMLESSQATLDTSIALSDAHHTSSQSSQGDLAIPQLEMPSAGSSGFDFGSFEFPGPVPGSPSHRFAIDNPDDVGFTMQPEFIFDEDGNFIDLSAPIEPLQPQSGITPGAQSEYQVVGQVAQQAAPASDEPVSAF